MPAQVAPRLRTFPVGAGEPLLVADGDEEAAATPMVITLHRAIRLQAAS